MRSAAPLISCVIEMDSPDPRRRLYAEQQGNQLAATVDAADALGWEAWAAMLAAEDRAFRTMHPNLTEEDQQRVMALLYEVGLSYEEFVAMATRPIFIDMNDPRAKAILVRAAGSTDGNAMVDAMAAAGISQAEIETAISRPALHFRDHRVQELIYRASLQ